jgi:uncharacterized protein (TIGR00251 family)
LSERPPASDSGIPALRAVPGGTRIAIRVQPRASRTELVGLHGDALRIRLAAPPVDGAANEALVRFLAERLGVPRPAVELVAGHTGRAKIVLVHGLTPSQARQALGLA